MGVENSSSALYRYASMCPCLANSVFRPRNRACRSLFPSFSHWKAGSVLKSHVDGVLLIIAALIMPYFSTADLSPSPCVVYRTIATAEASTNVLFASDSRSHLAISDRNWRLDGEN